MSIFIQAKKKAKTVEGSLQKFGKRIRANLKQDDADFAAGKVGAAARNPFRKNAKPAPQVNTVAVRSQLRAKRQKK